MLAIGQGHDQWALGGIAPAAKHLQPGPGIRLELSGGRSRQKMLSAIA